MGREPSLPFTMMSLRAASVSFARRCLSTNTPALAAAAPVADPIQNLFLTTVKDYAAKKAKGKGGLVDSTPAVEAELQNELDKVAKQYGGGQGVDMAAFPEFAFPEPKIDSIQIAQ